MNRKYNNRYTKIRKSFFTRATVVDMQTQNTHLDEFRESWPKRRRVSDDYLFDEYGVDDEDQERERVNRRLAWRAYFLAQRGHFAVQDMSFFWNLPMINMPKRITGVNAIVGMVRTSGHKITIVGETHVPVQQCDNCLWPDCKAFLTIIAESANHVSMIIGEAVFLESDKLSSCPLNDICHTSTDKLKLHPKAGNFHRGATVGDVEYIAMDPRSTVESVLGSYSGSWILDSKSTDMRDLAIRIHSASVNRSFLKWGPSETLEEVKSAVVLLIASLAHRYLTDVFGIPSQHKLKKKMMDGAQALVNSSATETISHYYETVKSTMNAWNTFFSDGSLELAMCAYLTRARQREQTFIICGIAHVRGMEFLMQYWEKAETLFALGDNTTNTCIDVW